MELPNLPQIKNKREANITPKVLKWFKANYPDSVALEIKSTATNSIPASALKPHQLSALLAVQTDSGLTHKIADTGHVQLPFDAFMLKHANSFVVACFTKRGVCLAIDPNEWNGANLATNCAFRFDI